MFAVAAIAEVAMHGQHSLGDFHDLFRREEADHVARAGIGLNVVVRAALTAANHQVVSDQFSIFLNRDKAEAIGEHIRVVQRRNREGRFKFPRQVGLAVKGIHKAFMLLIQIQLHAFHPDIHVGGRDGKQRGSDLATILQRRFAQGVRRWCGGGHDVAIHVAAGGQGVGHGVVDALDDLAEAFLDDAMKLKALA